MQLVSCNSSGMIRPLSKLIQERSFGEVSSSEINVSRRGIISWPVLCNFVAMLLRLSNPDAVNMAV